MSTFGSNVLQHSLQALSSDVTCFLHVAHQEPELLLIANLHLDLCLIGKIQVATGLNSTPHSQSIPVCGAVHVIRSTEKLQTIVQ